MVLPLPAILAPGQREDHDVKHRKREHPEGEAERQPVGLVDDEDREKDEHRRIRPESSAKDFEDEDELPQAVRKQVHGAEQSCSAEVRNRIPKVHSDHVIRILRALAKIKSNSASVHGLLGDVYWRLGRLKQAVQSFKRATELAPKSELASLGLFHILWESGKIERAKAEMKRYLAVGNSREYASMVPQLFANGNSSLSPNSKKIRSNSRTKNSLRRRY